MGCCGDKSTKTKKNSKPNKPPIKPNPTQPNSRPETISPADIVIKKPDLSEKQNDFINKFFNKELKPNEDEKRTSIFIKFQKKKIKVLKDLIQIEDQFTLTIKTGPSSYSDTFWYLVHEKLSNIKSKEIYIDGKKVDDNNFEIEGQNIQLQFEPLYNDQTKDVKIIYEYPHENPNYLPFALYFKQTDIVAQVLIYTSKDYQIDYVTNKKYTFDKDLNIVYFDGKTTDDTKGSHGYVYCSKVMDFQLNKKIPELKENEENIIRNKKSNGEGRLYVIGTYKYVKITDYGQEIEELYKVIGLNLGEGQFSSTLSSGLMLNTKYDVDLVRFNGKEVEYEKKESSIVIKNVGIYNNQCGEVYLKYKYYTNSEKHVYRQESIITGNIKNSYCNLNIEIPDKYVCLATDSIYQKDPARINKFKYYGISKEEQLYEKVKISITKGVWNIQKEIVLTGNANITSCTFKINRLFKGGNLKEKSYELIKDNAEFEDNKTEDRYIYKYKDLNTNKIKIGWKLQAENSTSDYKYNR